MDAFLRDLIDAIGPMDIPAMNWARRRHEQLTKPPGSLGRLEEIAVRLAGITGQTPPSVSVKTVIVAAADHGVADEGVSAYPKEVTRQMVENFVRGGAAINVLARGVGAKVVVIDAGVDADLSALTDVVQAKARQGTGNIALGPAMTREEAIAAIGHGARVAQREVDAGAEIIATGDMGIGNTTASSALTAVLARRAVHEVTGRGTGITAEQLKTKTAVIERAIARNAPDPNDPLDVLHKVGGLEIAALVGVMLGAAGRRVPVVLDGFISGAAALVAAGLAPSLGPYLFAAHSSVEIGHRAILERLELAPLLTLDLRLGEGSGAVLALGVIEQAARVLAEMATFREAGVSGRSAPREEARRFARRKDGYLHALDGGIWDDPFVHVDGKPYRHIVSTDLDRLLAWAESRGLPRNRVVRRDLRDFRNQKERIAAWHIDLGGPYLDLS